MDQWRKRISRIATSFEVAHKAELKTAEKQPPDSKAKQVSYDIVWLSCRVLQLQVSGPRELNSSVPVQLVLPGSLNCWVSKHL